MVFQFIGNKQLSGGRSGEPAFSASNRLVGGAKKFGGLFLDSGRVVGIVSLPIFSGAGCLRMLRQADL